MRDTKTRRKFWTLLLMLLVAGVSLSILSCAPLTTSPPEATPGSDGEPYEAEGTDVVCTTSYPLDLDSPTLPTPPTAIHNKNCDWDYFAWSSFAALNWPANSSLRGFPDVAGDSTFKNASNSRQLVWETFKEKREVFRPDPKPWNSPEDFPKLGYVQEKNGGFCEGSDSETSIDRTLFSVGKLRHTLDETVEVASEARENTDQLCKGHVKNSAYACLQKDPPKCCSVHGRKVGPRVWKGLASKSKQPVYYEVRVNYDFFKYVTENNYFDDRTALTGAILGQISLPYRTVDPKRPGSPPPGKPSPGQNSNAVVGYRPGHCMEIYDDPSKSDQLPCLVGAIHIKSAWIQLPDPYDPTKDPKDDNPAHYHTTRAIYFEPTNPPVKVPGHPDVVQVCKRIGSFGLIGLHIIQRVHVKSAHQTVKVPRRVTGGGFIFATWEHKNILNKEKPYNNYTYANYADPHTYNPPAYPALDSALPVVPLNEKSRLLPPTWQANTNVQRQLGKTASVWKHYHHIGTQFRPMPGADASEKNGQPFYLANLVIETNLGLQLFQGLPPQNPTILPPQYTITPTERLVPPNRTFSYDHDPTTSNMTFGGNAYNMGGCMGCHGVAQQNGYSFSFVLLGGQRGAHPDSEVGFEVASPSLVGPSIDLTIGIPVPGSNTETTKFNLEADTPGGKVFVKPASESPYQRWQLQLPIAGSSPSSQGSYTIQTKDELHIQLKSDKPDQPITVTKAGFPYSYWAILPTEIDVNTGKGYFKHVYNVMLGITTQDGTELVLQRKTVKSMDGVTKVIKVIAAPADSGNPEQLWRLQLVPPVP